MMSRLTSRTTAPSLLALFCSFLLNAEVWSQTVTKFPAPSSVGKFQRYQDPFSCEPCHPRQFRENRQSVKSGYRNFSPTFNALELAGNYAAQGALEAGLIANNLRPVYDRPNFSNFNARTGNNNNLRAGFCFGCHAAFSIGLGANAAGVEVAPVEVPPWDGIRVQNPDGPPGQLMIVGANTRPLRDYHYVNAEGKQALPADFGGMPPAGARTSLAGNGVNCDFCHNLAGAPDFDRSLQGDGFANAALQLVYSNIKVGPFKNAVPPRGNFHQSSSRDERINYLRSAMLCNACHDVRVPTPDIVSPDSTRLSPNMGHFRLENLSTEWAIGPYNNATGNPFGQIVRCQDCHMSLYPYGGNSTYSVRDAATGETLTITSPTPAVFAINFAAEPGISTAGNIPLPRRRVVTHYFTGIDVPLLYDDELQTFLGADYPSVSQPGVDEYGIPLALETRRLDLARAAVRIDLNRSDRDARLGERYNAIVRAVALTGHNLPAGFSQERGVWVQLTVSAKRSSGAGDVILYQSGYLVDKPHPETDEPEPDGNFHDEDQEHIEAVVNPFTHDNEVFQLGPDDGPHARIFEGRREGLVFFRNELVRIYGPGNLPNADPARATRIPAGNRRHPRTNLELGNIMEEETFSAGQTNFVDNWRALPPLYPRSYTYEIHLPSAAELEHLGYSVEGPLKVSARVHFQHFPPLFLRFLARVAGAYVERNLYDSDRLAPFVGLRGPANRNLNLYSEQRIDDLLRIMYDIAAAEITVPLNQ